MTSSTHPQCPTPLSLPPPVLFKFLQTFVWLLSFWKQKKKKKTKSHVMNYYCQSSSVPVAIKDTRTGDMMTLVVGWRAEKRPRGFLRNAMKPKNLSVWAAAARLLLDPTIQEVTIRSVNPPPLSFINHSLAQAGRQAGMHALLEPSSVGPRENDNMSLPS